MKLIHGWIAAIFILVSGCSNDELTREGAAEKIEEIMLTASENSYAFAPGGFDQGFRQGYWSANGTLTEKGQRLFSSVSELRLIPKTLPNYEVTVSGITDATSAEGVKEVQFDLSNDAVEGPARRFIISGGKGIVHFRKFDDGWRGELKDFQQSSNTLVLSASERKAMETEFDEESKRRADVYRKATTATLYVDFACNSALDSRSINTNVTVSDVSVSVEEAGLRTSFTVVLFKDVKSWSIEDFYGKKIIMDTTRGRMRFYQDCSDIDNVNNALQTHFRAWKQKWAGVDLSET